ncbi:hypothetical protein [Paraburkholderia caffeinilytica]|uniref:hypothetical protein n=1 Tax=Paraburkholderia caffeinilytica TaxID=1761016 RepID=UPI003D9FB6CC
MRQGRGSKGAQRVGGIHGGLLGYRVGCYGLFCSRVLAIFCFESIFALLADLLLGFKRLIYPVDAFVLRFCTWLAIDATDYVMRTHGASSFSLLLTRPAQSRDFTKHLWDEANRIIEEC